MGVYLYQLQHDFASAKRFLDFVFHEKQDMRVCDYIGYVWYVVSSPKVEILEYLLKKIDGGTRHRVMDVRDRLGEIKQIASEQLATIEA